MLGTNQFAQMTFAIVESPVETGRFWTDVCVDNADWSAADPNNDIWTPELPAENNWQSVVTDKVNKKECSNDS